MTLTVSLPADIESLGAAIGILKPSGGGFVLDTDFFHAPWARVSRLLSDAGQRAALVTSLERLLPATDSALPPAATDVIRRCFPMLGHGTPGQIYLVVERASPAPSSELKLGILAEAATANGGPVVFAEMVLLIATGSAVAPAFASLAHPLNIEASAPLGTDGTRLAIAVKVIAPPDEARSRLVVRLTGLPNHEPPLEFDISDTAPHISPMVGALIQIALAAAGPNVAAEVRRAAESLLGLLGLVNGLPPLPVGALATDSGAFRTWLGTLAGTTTADGCKGLVAWFDALGRMIGATPLAAPWPNATEADPIVLQLLKSSGAGSPTLALTGALRVDPAHGASLLVVGLRVEIASAAVDAVLRGEAVLMAIPLAGTGSTTVLERIELRIDAPATGGALLPAGGALAVDNICAGIRCAVGADGPTVSPILELRGVDFAVGATPPLHFDRIDLSSANTLTAAAGAAVETAISKGLGGAGDIVNALRTLAGLVPTAPRLDLAHFASAPSRAIAAYYRALRATPAGWSGVLSALGTLMGVQVPAAAAAGNANDPWLIELDALVVAGSPAKVGIALWDAGDLATPRLSLALRIAADGNTWSIASTAQLLGIDLADSEGGAIRWLGELDFDATLVPPAASAVAGLAVSAANLRLSAHWSPGAPLAVGAKIEGLSIDSGTATVDLGSFALPLAAPLDLTLPDLGLGLDPAALWEATRLLLARAVGSWHSPAARSLLALVGIAAPGTPGIADDLPPLALPTEGDVGSLLRSPAEAVRTWLATLVADAAGSVSEEGIVYLPQLLRVAQAILTDRTPRPGNELPVPDFPVSGAGSPDDPWAVPLHPTGGMALELLVWSEPSGPPPGWSAAVAQTLGSSEFLAGDLIEAARQLGDTAPRLAAALAYRDEGLSARRLQGFSNLLTSGDGLLVAAANPILPDGWTAGDPVAAAHHLVPRDQTAIDQVRRFLQQCTEGLGAEQWSVLLLAPRLAGADCWEALLSNIAVADRATISLRSAQASPAQVDLGGIESARWYAVDLADDGDAPLADVTTRLGQVVDAVRRVRGSGRVVLVTHSYLGLVAQAYVTDAASKVLGIAALVPPFGTHGVVALDDPDLGEAVRLAVALAPFGIPGDVGAGVTFLAQLLDGYAEPVVGRPPTAAPFHAAAFQRTSAQPTDLHGLPALTIAGAFEDDLLSTLASSLAFAVQLGSERKAPTHLGWGARVGLGLPPAVDGDPEVDLSIRLGWGRLALTPVVTGVTPQPIEVRARIARPDGWLLGGPGDGRPQATRVRWLELIGRLDLSADGATAISIDFRLHDAALRGAAAAEITLADAAAAELLDAVFQALDAQAKAGGRLEALLGILVTLGVARRRSVGVAAGVLVDGLRALHSDGVSLLATRLAPMLDASAGLLGLRRAVDTAAGGGPWRLVLAPLNAELVVDKLPWRITLRTTGAGLPIAPAGSVQTTGTVRLGDLVSEVTGALAIGGTTLGRAAPAGPVILDSSFLDTPLTLVPGDPTQIGPALLDALPRLLVGGVLTALVEQHVGPGFVAAPLAKLLRDPAAFFVGSSTLGDGVLPRADALNALFSAIANTSGLQSTATMPLVLPGGFVLKAADVGAGNARTLQLTLATDTPIKLDAGGAQTLALDLRLAIDRQRHVTPGGQGTLHIALPGGTTWGAIDLTAGAHVDGLTFGLATASGVAVTLLPTVSGLDTLVSAASRQLLPAILDELTKELAARNPAPAALADVLAVASAFGIYDDTAGIGSGFANKAPELASFEARIVAGDIQPLAPAIAAALAALLNRVLGQGMLAPVTSAGQVGIHIPQVLGGTIDLLADLSSPVPGLRVKATGLAAGAVTLTVNAGFATGAFDLALDAIAAIDTGAGLVLTPRLLAGLGTSGGAHLAVELHPLGNADVVIALAPTPVTPTLADLGKLANAWIPPLAGTLLLRAAEQAGGLARVLPVSGKTISDLLVAMNLAAGTSGSLRFVTPIRPPLELIKRLLDFFASTPVRLPGSFTLAIVTDGQRYGLAIGGEQTIDAGDYAIAVRLGIPAGVDPGWGAKGKGVGLLLLDLSTPAAPKLTPMLRLGGCGMRIGRKDETSPLIDMDGFRLGAAAAYLSTDITLIGTGAPKALGNVYGAVELEGLGLLIGAGANSTNPVAASLFQGDSSGDQTPANPPFDLLVGNGPSGWRVLVSGETKIRVEVHKTFGPLHIDAMDIRYIAVPPGAGKIGFGIDGGISLAGLAVGVKDFDVRVPIEHPSNISDWTLDLAGLAVSLDTDVVKISGGLLKVELPDRTIDYEGMLGVQVAGLGLTATGAYGQPSDALGRYTSLFVFVAVSQPLGGPPYLFVTGLAGGAGLNRQLLVPRDPAAIATFPLVAAMTSGGPSDPMARLAAISHDIPPRRGSFWLAAGIRFSTFEIVHTTALVTVALERALEVNLLGLMQLALPTAEDAVVSLELALVAKYSTVDQILSVRAGLTPNSWLISRDCRLTGGFAFVVWFGKPEVLLTVGGYSAKFRKPDYYPDVPRVGFHWDVGGGIVVKGESFFALTHSALMLGGALEASYDVDPVKVWFSAGLDVIVFWDPFHYDVDAYVSVGASFHFEVCFIACATISTSVSLGAWLHLEGPPLHATVTIDLAIASVTVEFGSYSPQNYLPWGDIWKKYLSAGDATKPATAAAIAAGTVPGDAQANGSLAAPWTVAAEFSLRVETKLPASRWRLGPNTSAMHNAQDAPPSIDVVPANPAVLGRIRGDLIVAVERSTPAGWRQLTTRELASLATSEKIGHFPGAIWDAASNADPTRPQAMLAALGALELNASVRTYEATGTLGDISLATMIEEEAALPLSFGQAAATKPLRVIKTVVSRKAHTVAIKKAPPPTSDAGLHPPRTPSLRLTAHHPLASSDALRRALPVSKKTAAGRLTGVELLPAGGAHFWDLEPRQAHKIKLTSASTPMRIVALGGTGGVLADGLAVRGKAVAPVGATTVVVAEASSTDTVGWELGTPLLHAAPATLLAPGATVHLPHPWTPPRRPGATGGPQWVKAAVVTAAMDETQTRFARGSRAAPTVIVVRLDPLNADGRPEDVHVEVTGATVSAARVVGNEGRVDLLFTVRRLQKDADAIVVRVTTGGQWRLAGVVGITGTSGKLTRALSRDPHLRLQTIIAPNVDLPASHVSVRPITIKGKR